MNKIVIALIALFAVSMALDPEDIMPCAFQITTYTRILSGGALLGTSDDTLYRDHNDLWRWDSDFTGVTGLFDGHMWSIVWRPDLDSSYHSNLMTGKCLKNNGGSAMYPIPYKWVEQKTGPVDWTQEECVYNDKPAIKYTGKAKSTSYQFTLETNIFTTKSGDFMYANGTVMSNMVDIVFTTELGQYIAYSPVPPKTFMPQDANFKDANKCEAVVYPADPSKEFSQVCYNHGPQPSSSHAGGSAFAINPSISLMLISLLAILMICLAL